VFQAGSHELTLCTHRLTIVNLTTCW
jgi:hypothetical protein